MSRSAIEKHLPILAIGGHPQLCPCGKPRAMQRIRQLMTKVWDAGLPVIDDLHTASYEWKAGSQVRPFHRKC